MLMYGPTTNTANYCSNDASSFYVRHSNKNWKYTKYDNMTEVSELPSFGIPKVSHVDTKTYYFEHTPSATPPTTATGIGNYYTYASFYTNGTFTAIGHPDSANALTGAPHRQVWIYKDSDDSYFGTITNDVPWFGCNVYGSSASTNVRVFVMNDPVTVNSNSPGHVYVYTSPIGAANFTLENTWTATVVYNKKYGVEINGWSNDTHEFIIICYGEGQATAQFYRRSLTGTTWENWGSTGQLGKVASIALLKLDNTKVLIAAGNFDSHRIRVGHMPYDQAIAHGDYDYQYHTHNFSNIGEGMSISSDGLTVTASSGPRGGNKNMQWIVDHVDEWTNAGSNPWVIINPFWSFTPYRTSSTAIINHGTKNVYLAVHSHLNASATTGTPLKIWLKDKNEQGTNFFL